MWKTKLSEEKLQEVLSEAFADFDSRYSWMFIWIGKIFTKADGNLLVQVALVRIAEKVMTEFNISKLDFGEIRTASLHVSLIPLIRPGSIFTQGKIQLQKHCQYLRPNKIIIDTACSNSHSLENWKYGGALRKQIGLKRNDLEDFKEKKEFCQQSKIWVVKNCDPNLDAELIVYPSNELIRFYLFRSTRLTGAILEPILFSGKKNALYDPRSLKLPDADAPFHGLYIRDEMLVRDVHVIARIAFSPEAKKAANSVYLSYKNKMDFIPGQVYLDSCFPFQGTAVQEVYGFTIALEGVKTFIVLEIGKCYSKYPFKSLRYDTETPQCRVDKNLKSSPGKRYDPENKNADGSGPPPKIQYYYEPKFDNNTTADSDIKNDRKFNKAEYVDKEPRFPNLTRDIKRIFRLNSVPPKIDPDTRKSLPASNISTNDNKGNKTGSAGFEVISDELNGVEYYYPGNYIDLLNYIVDHFKKMKCKIKYHNLLDQYGQEELCFIKIDVNELELDPKQMGFAEMANGKRRRCVAIDVEYESSHFLICEFEPQGNTSYRIFLKESNQNKYSQFMHDDVKLIIDEIVKSAGNLKKLPNMKLYKFYHEKTSPSAHAVRILKGIGFLTKKKK